MYHGLWASDADYDNIPVVDRPYAIHSTAFEAQMARISDLGLQRNVLITFDDGHASSRTVAMPILAKYGMVAKIFVTTAWTDTLDHFCTTDDLLALKRAGWTIGAHGHTHRFLTTINDDELESELRNSHELLASHMGDTAEMSFPGGRFGEREIDAAKAFYLVRDMPYQRASSREPQTIIDEWRGTCSGKHYLLKALFAELGYSSRVVVCTTVEHFDPQKYEGRMRTLLEECDGRFVDAHNYLILELPEGEMIVDATWPIATKGRGTVVNEYFVLGENQKIAAEPSQSWKVPTAVIHKNIKMKY